ncbi:MAG: DEAD/DEAH box helicase, partial [Desulfobacterales bacterium]
MFADIGAPEDGPFVPDPFQREALKTVAQADCLVTAPTGAGKTWIARQAMARVIKSGGRCWYASPLKALSNAKYLEFSEFFGFQQVGILTGDRRENSGASLIVGTTEILRNQLYDAMSDGQTLAADLVVLDEAHYLGDPQRGVVWEEIIIYLPARITLLLLSATIGNASQLAGWLSSVRNRSCQWVRATVRPVPLEPLVLHPGGTLLPLEAPKPARGRKSKLHPKVRQLGSAAKPWSLKGSWGRPPFGHILDGLRKMKLSPAIFFLKSRKDCDMALKICARELAGALDPNPRRTQRVTELLDDHPFLKYHRHRRFLEHYGIGAHHSGHLPAWKLILETLMGEGLLNAIFATSTVAAGINVPARAVVFFNTDRFNGHEFAPLTATEFHQMTGRAGRRGMDRVGFVVGIPGRFMDLSAYGRLVRSPAGEIVSQIQVSFSMVLNLLLSHPPAQVEDLLARSFAAYQLKGETPQNVSPRPSPLSGTQALTDSFRRHVRFLRAHGYLDSEGHPTADGVWAARLRVDQPLLIAEAFRQGAMPEEDPALLAAVVAAFVSEREYEQDDELD